MAELTTMQVALLKQSHRNLDNRKSVTSSVASLLESLNKLLVLINLWNVVLTLLNRPFFFARVLLMRMLFGLACAFLSVLACCLPILNLIPASHFHYDHTLMTGGCLILCYLCVRWNKIAWFLGITLASMDTILSLLLIWILEHRELVLALLRSQ